MSAKPIPPSEGGPLEFVQEGEIFTWIRDAKYYRVRLKNRRVILGYDGRRWALEFKHLVDARKRQIQSTKIALSNEAMEALVILWRTFKIESEADASRVGREEG